MKKTVFELKKILTPLACFLLLVVLVFKVLICICTPEPEYGFSKERYHTYLETMQAFSTDEQKEFVAAEDDRLNNVLSQEEFMSLAYAEGEITLETYNEYHMEYLKAQSEKPAFDAIVKKYEYFQTLQQNGKSTTYFYDLAVISYLQSLCKPDYAYISFLVFSIINALAMDREYNLYEMVYATTFGRADRYKILAILQFVVCTFFFTAVADFGLYFHYAPYELLKTELYNMEVFSTCNYSITVLACVSLVLAVKFFWSITLGIFIYAMYLLCKNKIVGCFVVFTAIFIPIFLADSINSPLTDGLIGVQLSGGSVITSSLITSFVAWSTSMIALFAFIMLRKTFAWRHRKV